MADFEVSLRLPTEFSKFIVSFSFHALLLNKGMIFDNNVFLPLALCPIISEACPTSVVDPAVDPALYSGLYKSCLLFSQAFCYLITTYLFSLTTRLL